MAIPYSIILLCFNATLTGHPNILLFTTANIYNTWIKRFYCLNLSQINSFIPTLSRKKVEMINNNECMNVGHFPKSPPNMLSKVKFSKVMHKSVVSFS